MMYVENAAGLWIAPSGVMPNVLLFQLVSNNAAWWLLSGLLASVCALLLSAVTPQALFGAGRKRRGYSRPRRRALHVAPKRRPQPQHT